MTDAPCCLPAASLAATEWTPGQRTARQLGPGRGAAARPGVLPHAGGRVLHGALCWPSVWLVVSWLGDVCPCPARVQSCPSAAMTVASPPAGKAPVLPSAWPGGPTEGEGGNTSSRAARRHLATPLPSGPPPAPWLSAALSSEGPGPAPHHHPQAALGPGVHYWGSACASLEGRR